MLDAARVRLNSFVISFTLHETKERRCCVFSDSCRGDDFGLDAYSTNGRVEYSFVSGHKFLFVYATYLDID